MTTDEDKNRPAFHIFDESNKNRLGAAFKHKKGEGFNILIGKVRYVAFPPRRKKSESEEGEK